MLAISHHGHCLACLLVQFFFVVSRDILFRSEVGFPNEDKRLQLSTIRYVRNNREEMERAQLRLYIESSGSLFVGHFMNCFRISSPLSKSYGVPISTISATVGLLVTSFMSETNKFKSWMYLA